MTTARPQAEVREELQQVEEDGPGLDEPGQGVQVRGALLGDQAVQPRTRPPPSVDGSRISVLPDTRWTGMPQCWPATGCDRKAKSP